MYDLPENNMIFVRRETSFFTGSGGVFVLFLRNYTNFQNLKLKCRSPHLPKHMPVSTKTVAYDSHKFRKVCKMSF